MQYHLEATEQQERTLKSLGVSCRILSELDLIQPLFYRLLRVFVVNVLQNSKEYEDSCWFTS